ncbi:hypothetical protein HOK51_09880 [Candidatus Woesearchaeota archaeon]|jgi:large subunit ribosomal protein L37Ae|nr:hypothetical protein [Candidatus Woesearchaeota archaeon]MBT6520132.1 hypothetical protein [Candidatus Woesearchaeota archaeon]MBT7366737.1 hypothetical protein [Candidatus Woesearchaeota archaeon]
MAKQRLRSPSKRFGPRYGGKNRLKVDKIEKESRKTHKCPYCSYVKVTRVSRGIWFCDKCKAKFVGKAYTIQKEKKVEHSPELYEVVGIESQKQAKEDLEEEAEEVAA